MSVRSLDRKSKLRSVGLIFKPEPRRAGRILRNVTRWLDRKRITWAVDPQTAALHGKSTEGIPRDALAARSDLIIVVGGDGTLLSVARQIGSSRTPILGVNLGSLGFLTAIPIGDLYPALEGILAGVHRVTRRIRLQVETLRDGRRVTRHEVLNDVVVAKSALARILDINVDVDGRFMTIFQADGLIVCTPTGSTAYSLSAGGPIMDPTLDAMILNPICPHTLTNRPVVAPGRSRVEVSLARNHGEVYVTLDGQVGAPFRSGDRLRIRKSPHPTCLVQFPENDYFDVLRHKLKWGGRLRQRSSG